MRIRKRYNFNKTPETHPFGHVAQKHNFVTGELEDIWVDYKRRPTHKHQHRYCHKCKKEKHIRDFRQFSKRYQGRNRGNIYSSFCLKCLGKEEKKIIYCQVEECDSQAKYIVKAIRSPHGTKMTKHHINCCFNCYEDEIKDLVKTGYDVELLKIDSKSVIGFYKGAKNVS